VWEVLEVWEGWEVSEVWCIVIIFVRTTVGASCSRARYILAELNLGVAWVKERSLLPEG